MTYHILATCTLLSSGPAFAEEAEDENPTAVSLDDDEASEDERELPTELDLSISTPQAPDPAPATLQPYLAGGAGASLGVSTPGVGPAFRLEAGAGLPAWQGRLLPFLALSWAVPRSSGTLGDHRLPGDLSWELRQRALQLGIGAHGRLLPASASVSPELTVGVGLVAVDARIESRVGDASATIDHGWSTRPGWLIGAGMATSVGPGRASASIELSGTSVDGRLTGDASTRGLTPIVGYRVSP